MEQNNATMDAELTEYLCAIDNHDDSIDGPAKRTHIRNGMGSWQVDHDGGEELGEDPDEYRVECSCGAEFSSWGQATHHVEEDH